ncbi:hypothetical protein SKAU_G00372970 [Synaphobranchus kaupii]|uniref:polynucleotide adenylyltransferase n=1 Tax=Synaphobranchus kaupii TaxID=118154 RepID=A0A9Q1EGF7_SYNKA|nr:hypothetical protein SKAU_G00372970 [Synaphobranchus kaupii]
MTELSTDRRFHSLTQEQVQTLDQVLTEVIPIHGRGNFPTLEVKPKDIIHMVRNKLTEKDIKVRDVRLNGSTASHVLVKENGTSYKDLDIIFGVELPKQEDFQIIKDVVLRCLLDFLPKGVNKDKITALTMKEAYVQKMVKVFTEHDRWSLISLSNNSGKNVELKFVNSLRRQFEFSVDSFQIILDRMLESYLEAERRQGYQHGRLEDRASVGQRTSQLPAAPAEFPSTSLDLDKPQSLDKDLVGGKDGVSSSGDSSVCAEEALELAVEVPESVEQRLESDLQVAEPVAQCAKLQMEAAPHNQETEATVPTRDLPAITVVAESMYGDFEQAMDHLRYRLIATRNPEEIRGGGLLKYSNLLVREFKPASETEIKTLERYMCSRFFIDFPDVNEQQRKIESYLRNHFIGEEKSKYDYLMTLRRVVNESTVCLMGHERRQTLNMITVLALKVLGEQNIIPNTTNVTCYYQPAPYMADHSFNNYYIAHGQPPLFYQPYPLHIHMQTGLV